MCCDMHGARHDVTLKCLRVPQAICNCCGDDGSRGNMLPGWRMRCCCSCLGGRTVYLRARARERRMNATSPTNLGIVQIQLRTFARTLSISPRVINSLFMRRRMQTNMRGRFIDL